MLLARTAVYMRLICCTVLLLVASLAVNLTFRIFPAMVKFELSLRLRLAAICSKLTITVYREGRKLHDEMSEFLFGKGYTKEDKMRAKAVNFGIAYGREGPSIASEFGVDVAVANQWVQNWFKRAPGAKKFLDKIRAVPLRRGTLISPFGNKRRFPLVSATNLRSLQNEAANFPMQCIASMLTLHAAMEADEELESGGAYIVNLVHDSILVECDDRPEEVARVARVLKRCMEGQAHKWLRPPIEFPAEFKLGRAWGDKHMQDYHLPALLAA
jgi:DNA polymerase-1